MDHSNPGRMTDTHSRQEFRSLDLLVRFASRQNEQDELKAIARKMA
jgi:hypothetical protein